jgi:hypothetical protein
MKIVIKDAPEAGKLFFFGVEHESDGSGYGPIRTRVSVAGVSLIEDDCLDPPCYQMRVMVGPQHGGKTMTIEAVAVATRAYATLRIQILSTPSAEGMASA